MAFYGCTSLSSVELGAHVTNIWNEVFYGCAALTSIDIPDTIESIHGTSFKGTGIVYNQYGNGNYLGNENHPYLVLISAESQDIGEITISEQCRVIAGAALNGCTRLSEINIPSSVTNIGYSAFSGCTALTSMIIPETVKSVGAGILTNCTGLKSASILGKTTEFDLYSSGILEGCSALESVTIANMEKKLSWYFGDAGQYQPFSPGYLKEVTAGSANGKLVDSAFVFPYSNPPITTITILEGVTSIGDYVFNQSTITTLSLPSTLTSIGVQDFDPLTSLTFNDSNDGYYLGNENNPYLYLIKVSSGKLTSFVMEEGCKFMAEKTFDGKTYLTSVTLSDGLTSISDYAFNKCTNLQSVTLPANLVSIGKAAFYDCKLQSIVIPDSVTTIGDYAFYLCSSASKITMSKNVVTIGEHAFYGCSKAHAITLPETLTSIGDYAFYGMTFNSAVVLPDSLLVLGRSAFGLDSKAGFKTQTSGNATIYYLSSPTVEYFALIGIQNTIYTISVKDECRLIARNAFSNCDSVTRIDIPTSVIFVGSNAFPNTWTLKNIYCKAASKPEGWECEFPSYATVHWGA